MLYLRKSFYHDGSGEVVVYDLADLILLCLWHLHKYGWSFTLLHEEVEMTGGVKRNNCGEETL